MVTAHLFVFYIRLLAFGMKCWQCLGSILAGSMLTSWNMGTAGSFRVQQSMPSRVLRENGLPVASLKRYASTTPALKARYLNIGWLFKVVRCGSQSGRFRA